ncbi:MAG: IS110 family transposase [Candidatus Zixiibacteriota bacterium]
MRSYDEARSDSNTIYVGIDVHKKSWHVTIRTADRQEWSGSIVAEWEVLEKVLGRYSDGKVVAVYEAGFSGFWLYDRLVSWGAECLVTPPSLIPSTYGNHVKTDRLDSAKLALLLSRGLLKAVWVPDPEARRHRQVIRRRRQLIGDRIRTQCRIKSELACFGVPLPEINGKWSRAFEQHLWQIRFADRWQTESFQGLLKQYQMLSELIDQQTRLLRELSLTERYGQAVKHLCSIPGIGLLTAMELLLELGDFTRFPRGSKLAAYVGLTPSQYSSGEKVRLGRITGIGKPQLRASLIESAWVLIRKDAAQRLRYEQLRQRCGSKRAIVAMARRLLLIARRLLLDQQSYRLKPAA